MMLSYSSIPALASAFFSDGHMPPGKVRVPASPVNLHDHFPMLKDWDKQIAQKYKHHENLANSVKSSQKESSIRLLPRGASGSGGAGGHAIIHLGSDAAVY